MSYSIDYSQDMPRRMPLNEKQDHFPMMISVGILIVIIAAFLLWPGMGQSLKEALTPGDFGITTGAFETMVNSLSQGESVRDAFAEFCRDVIVGASAQ